MYFWQIFSLHNIEMLGKSTSLEENKWTFYSLFPSFCFVHCLSSQMTSRKMKHLTWTNYEQTKQTIKQQYPGFLLELCSLWMKKHWQNEPLRNTWRSWTLSVLRSTAFHKNIKCRKKTKKKKKFKELLQIT